MASDGQTLDAVMTTEQAFAALPVDEVAAEPAVAESVEAEAPLKRAASKGSASKPAKKARKSVVVDDTPAKVKLVTSALATAQTKGVASELTSMLTGMVEHALPVFKEDRHAFQAEAVQMVSEVLTQAEAALVAEVASAEQLVSGGDAQKQERATAVETTSGAVAASEADVEAKAAAKASTLEVFHSADEFLKDAQASQKEGDADAVALDASKAELDKALAEVLVPMKEAGGGKRQLNVLTTQLTKAGLDQTLIHCVHLPLTKKPEARGSFDLVVLQQLEQEAAKKVAALGALVQAAAPAREVRAATVLSAQAGHDAAKIVSEAAAAAFTAAKEAEKSAKSAAVAAKAAVKSLSAELLQAAVTADKAIAALAAFRSGPLVAFAELRERSAPAPEAEAPAPEAPAEA